MENTRENFRILMSATSDFKKKAPSFLTGLGVSRAPLCTQSAALSGFSTCLSTPVFKKCLCFQCGHGDRVSPEKLLLHQCPETWRVACSILEDVKRSFVVCVKVAPSCPTNKAERELLYSPPLCWDAATNTFPSLCNYFLVRYIVLWRCARTSCLCILKSLLCRRELCSRVCEDTFRICLRNFDYDVDFLCYTSREFDKLSKMITIVREAVRKGILIT